MMAILNTGMPVILLLCAALVHAIAMSVQLRGSVACEDVTDETTGFAAIQQSRRLSGRTRVLSVIPSACAVLLSRAGYELLQDSGMKGDFRWCFTLGLAGLLLGTCLTARLTGHEISRVSDRLAPVMCLCMAVARLSQRWLGITGAGPVMQEGFPLVLMNEWGEPLLALFLAEALAALLGAAATRLPEITGKTSAPWTPTARGLTFLLIPQILLEQLRTGQTMRWGMVRAEQPLCALFAFVVLLLLSRQLRIRGKSLLSSWTSAGVFLLLTGGVVWIEFVLDGKAAELPEPVAWSVFSVIILAMMAVILINCGRLDRSAGKGRS